VYTLLVTQGPDAGLRHPIRDTRVSVGRSNEMDLVLTDPSIRPHHFMVIFEEGGWKAITYAPDATILIDRRWEHPRTHERGARIFAGDTQLLLFAGDIDLDDAHSAAEGLDIDEETLRDDALTTVGNEAYEFRHDMMGKATRVSDPKNKSPSRAPGRGAPSAGTPRPIVTATPERTPRPAVVPQVMSPQGGTPRPQVGPNLPQGVMSSAGSQMAGMMRLPATIEQGRQQGAGSNPPQEPRSARATWSPREGTGTSSGASASSGATGTGSQSRALTRGIQIKLTDTAIAAMPSQSRDLWVLYQKDGPFAAELRILATRLEELKSTFGYKSFLFTSVNSGEGKTVTAANLALVMSEDPERKVALVDANFRSPRAADLFNLDKGRGLLSAIAGQRSLSECVARVLGRNLIVLHAGGEHKNPAQVLSDPKFKTLVTELSQAIDFMIIDAPCAVPYADVPLLAQHADAVFMVVGAHETKRSDLDKALDTIGRNRVVGSIFRDHIKGKK
jgi:protein-tyrosine kinase